MAEILSGRRIASLLFFFYLGCASSAQAERWYRVELLAFGQSGNEYAEQWEPTPTLEYPQVARFLMHSSEATAAKQIEIVTAAPSSQSDANGGGEIDVQEETQLASAFVLLPPEQHEFTDATSLMKRKSQYQVLFHEAWVQPVAAQSDALPIILERSGDTGHWPALQGSITLYLSRYLHLETNLWLNTQGDYLGGSWQMPAAPLAPRSAMNAEGTALLNALPADDIEEEATAATHEPDGEQSRSLYWLEQEQLDSEQLRPVYPFRHAILLQQQRRMRSTEIHYVDHPMMGLIIKLTPLETQELESAPTTTGLSAPSQQ